VLGDPEKARTMWIVLHGHGQLARFFLNKFEGIAKDALIVAPEGLSRFYLDDQHQRVGATWMTREDREHEIKDHVDYLDGLVQALQAGRNDRPVHVLGFSQGVATASRWSLLGRTRIAQLVLWAGSLPPEPTAEQLRERWQHLRIDLVLGTKDPFAGEDAMQAGSDRLIAAKLGHRVHRFEGGHVLEPVLLGRLMRS
jgi:predicted esterase